MTSTRMGTIYFPKPHHCFLMLSSDTISVWHVRIALRSGWKARFQVLTPDLDFHREAACVARRQKSSS
jgi:hypothetical protein